MGDEVLKHGRGRPPKPGALSGAERQAAHRDRKGGRTMEIGLALLKAKDAGDWSVIERLAREIMRS
jgi:hypothetical protein